MPPIPPRPLQGFRDRFGEEMDHRSATLARLESVIRGYGFQRLETPALEYKELIAPHSDQTQKLVYHFLDQGNRPVAMRYDLTTPTARFCAGNWPDLTKPFRRYQLQPVWRADSPGHGRYREFLQFDFDTFGSAGTLYDAEIIAVVHECLRSVDFPAHTIRLNHRRILNGLVEVSGLGPEHAVAAVRSLDKADRVGLPGVLREMTEAGLPGSAAEALLEAIREVSAPGLGHDEILARLGRRFAAGRSHEGLRGVEELATIVDALPASGVPDGAVAISATLARGLDYYDGPIHEVVAHEADIGSVCGGGRYDGLVTKFGVPGVPATGTSLGIERILDVLAAAGRRQQPPQVGALVCSTDRAGRLGALAVARALRARGVAAEAYLDEADSLRKQLKYADRRRIPFAILMPRPGDGEAAGVVVKEMSTGNQISLTREAVADHIAGTIQHREVES